MIKNLLLRACTGSVFIVLVLLSFILPDFYMFILFLIISIAGLSEYFKLAKRSGGAPLTSITYFLTITVYVLLFALHAKLIVIQSYTSFLLYASIIFLLPILITPIIELYRNKKRGLLNIALSYVPFFWIVIPLSLGTFWKTFEAPVVLAIFILVWLSDTLAYCFGMLFGKRKLFERISPKKTWEGFILSLISTILLSSIFAKIPYFHGEVFNTYLDWMGFALVVIVFGTYGDLVQSMFKRTANIKDCGKILPGHGGILDRFDSFLFALPAGFVYWLFMIL